MTIEAKRVLVHGRVQGVGFRYFVQRVANKLGLTGIVRNRFDSTVEIVVEGDHELIDEFLKEVAKGPSLARVERLEITDINPGGRYAGFLIEGW